MKLFVKNLYILSLVLLFLPAFAFPMSGRTYRVFFIFLLSLFALIIFFKNRDFLQKAKLFFHRTPFKYLVFFMGYLVIQTFVLGLLGTYNFVKGFSYLLQFLILYIIPCYFLSSYVTLKYFSLKKFIKWYFVILFIILAFGVIDFIGRVANISFIVNLQHILANERMFILKDLAYSEVDYIRTCSVFSEPGWFGNFIFFNFPIIYYCCLSKYKIFEKPLLNKLIKSCLIPLAWLDIILTISPIWPVFCIIQAIIIFRKKLIKLIFSKRFLYLILGCIPISLLTFSLIKSYSIELSILTRIFNTITTFLNLDKFVFSEPSLANRIISYILYLKLWFQHFFIGVGLNNFSNLGFNILYNSNLPVTLEIYGKCNKALETGQIYLNISALYVLLAETGLIGTILFYTFIVKCITFLKKLLKLFPEGILKTWGTGLSVSLTSFIFVTIYDTMIANPFLWFMLGMVITYYSHFVNSMKEIQEDNNNGCINNTRQL